MNIPDVTKAQAAIFTHEAKDCDDSKLSQIDNIRAFAPVKKPETQAHTAAASDTRKHA
jgi:hypothetical protein